MTETAEIMVIAPHPDDAESRVAGSVAYWVRQGKGVVYVVCTNGDKGSSDAGMKPEDLARIREEEQLAAANLLGVREVVFLRYPDQALEDTPEFRERIVKLIRMYKPGTVVTIDPYQTYLTHRDHRIAGQVTLDATVFARGMPAGPDSVEPGLQPHSVRELLLCGSRELNYRINITETFGVKMAALHCHKSQVGDRPELEERLRQRARVMAEGEDYELAEAFNRVEI